MDARRFDRLARAWAVGASRRGIVKGLVGGVVAGTFAQSRIDRARAQCTWTGTFQTTFGGITMTLAEAAGQVTGTYTFTDNTIAVSGTISGTVRTDTPGYTVLDGYWREPMEGGRLWFTMAEPCTQFTGWYTSTDVAQEWIAGWDGVRTSGGGAAEATADATFFSNPGDTRAAQFTMDGQTATLFGPKEADGGVQYISQASLSAADGDPQKQVLLEFDANGLATRATLARGDSMAFEWLSPTSVVVTYQNADGSQEVRFPYDAAPVAVEGATGRSRRLAYTGRRNPARSLAGSRLAPAAAQNALGSPGVIEVRCGAGELVGGAIVTGSMAPANAPGTPLEVSYTETSPGTFAYSLPIAPVPAAGEGFHRTRVERALTLICLGNTTILLTQVSKDVICATLLGIPAAGTVGFAACEVILTSYVWMCRLNFARVVGGAAVDFFAASFQVTARAQHAKLGTGQTTVTAAAGSAIPLGVIQLAGAAGIAGLTTEPLDPAPGQAYTIRAQTVCAPTGAQLTLSIIGSDNYPDSTTVTISPGVTEATLAVPGAPQGVYDTITAELSGPVTDKKTLSVTF